MTTRTTPFSFEVRERAVRMVRVHVSEHGSQWSAIQTSEAQVGCSSEALRNWMRRSEHDQRVHTGCATDESERMRALEREKRVFRQVNKIAAMDGVHRYC